MIRSLRSLMATRYDVSLRYRDLAHPFERGQLESGIMLPLKTA